MTHHTNVTRYPNVSQRYRETFPPNVTRYPLLGVTVTGNASGNASRDELSDTAARWSWWTAYLAAKAARDARWDAADERFKKGWQ
jgi:hypothetical protein